MVEGRDEQRVQKQAEVLAEAVEEGLKTSG
jgi:hypothetical protein